MRFTAKSTGWQEQWHKVFIIFPRRVGRVDEREVYEWFTYVERRGEHNYGQEDSLVPHWQWEYRSIQGEENG